MLFVMCNMLYYIYCTTIGLYIVKNMFLMQYTNPHIYCYEQQARIWNYDRTESWHFYIQYALFLSAIPPNSSYLWTHFTWLSPHGTHFTTETTEAMRLKWFAEWHILLMQGFETSTSVSTNRHSIQLTNMLPMTNVNWFETSTSVSTNRHFIQLTNMLSMTNVNW